MVTGTIDCSDAGDRVPLVQHLIQDLLNFANLERFGKDHIHTLFAGAIFVQA